MAIFHVCNKECSQYKYKNHPVKGHWVIENWEFDRCPATYIPESTYVWVRTYNFFKQGILPNKGGWLNQSFRFITIMEFLEYKLTEHKEQYGKK